MFEWWLLFNALYHDRSHVCCINILQVESENAFKHKKTIKIIHFAIGRTKYEKQKAKNGSCFEFCSDSSEPCHLMTREALLSVPQETFFICPEYKKTTVDLGRLFRLRFAKVKWTVKLMEVLLFLRAYFPLKATLSLCNNWDVLSLSFD